MAAAITAPSAVEPFVAVTLTGSGFTATTNYIVTVLGASGHTARIERQSDGSGAFTARYVPQTRGTYTVSVRPATEWNGTTTAAATASGATA